MKGRKERRADELCVGDEVVAVRRVSCLQIKRERESDDVDGLFVCGLVGV